jgi:hypothetical protein
MIAVSDTGTALSAADEPETAIMRRPLVFIEVAIIPNRYRRPETLVVGIVPVPKGKLEQNGSWNASSAVTVASNVWVIQGKPGGLQVKRPARNRRWESAVGCQSGM